MLRKLIFIVICIPLFACRAVTQSVPTSSEAIVLKPSATPSITPIATSTAIPPTASPEPTTDPHFFRDDFNGSLGAQWSWLREDPLNWSLTAIPGALQIRVGGGSVSEQTNSNLLLRPAPQGDFQIETQVTFSPRDNFQFAGLIIYESVASFIQAGRSFCGTFECVGEGLYMDYYRNGERTKPDFGQVYNEIDPIRLRLSRREDTYTFNVSADGKVWFVVGSHQSDMDPLQVGLLTGQRLQGDVLPAVFEYFEVRSLP